MGHPRLQVDRRGLAKFLADVDLWTACWWSPPPRGYVDPLKEMQANALGLQIGVLSHSDVIAEQGRDAEEVFEQIARDREDLADRGLEFTLAGAADRFPQETPPEEVPSNPLSRKQKALAAINEILCEAYGEAA